MTLSNKYFSFISNYHLVEICGLGLSEMFIFFLQLIDMTMEEISAI